MAVSKRTRYEVLRRDDHICRYCHATDSPLTVDHVTPVALGGTDDPNNLVAACRDCNAGKAASNPDAPLVAQVAEDALRWAAAIRVAGERAAVARQAQVDRLRPFHEFWSESTENASPWHRGRYELPTDWRPSIVSILDAGLPLRELLEAVIVTVDRRPVPNNAYRYLLGVTNKMLERLHSDARQLLTDGAV